jgi:translation initiation factor 3 subunit A
LNDPATLQRHLETRFSQLNSAAELQLWQEGFKSVDDISTIIEVSTKVPKPGMMADYYGKLAKILFKGENYLFHSAATEKHLLLQCGDPSSDLTGNPNLTEADHRKMASTFMVSVLAIPIIKSQSQEKNAKFQALLRDPEMPSREKLLRHALSHQVYSLVDPKVKELYELLEVQFHPLSICQKVGPIIQSFKDNDDLARYVKPLHQIILTRLLQQLSQVYSSIKIDGVLKLADFPAPYNYSTHTIERFVANGCKRGEFSIRINQQTQSLVFVPNSFGLIAEDATHYSLPADNMRSQLGLLAKRLVESIEMVNPAVKKSKSDAIIDKMRLAHENISTDRAEIYNRRALIARNAEKLEAEKEKEVSVLLIFRINFANRE